MASLVWLVVCIKGWFMGWAWAVMFGHRRSVLARGDWLHISLVGGFHSRMFVGVGVVMRIVLLLLVVCNNSISWLWCNNLFGCWHGHALWMVVLVSFNWLVVFTKRWFMGLVGLLCLAMEDLFWPVGFCCI